jgi:GT2 family glycosyltransferase
MSEIAIVIPALDRAPTLARALARLERQRAIEPGTFEVIVVIDAAAGDPAALLDAVTAASRPYPTRVLRSERRGASAARNAGWRATDAPVVLFLGADILALPGLVAAHLEEHRRDPSEGAAVLGLTRWPRRPPPSPFMRWLDRGIQFDYGRLTPGARAPWWHFYSSNVSVKRALLDRVGGFDEERFPFLYEDLDLGARMDVHGLRLRYLPAAEAEHLHRPRPQEWRARVALIAPAERRFCELHPQARPYFRELFAAALEHPRAHGRGARLAWVVPRSAPWIGPRVWASFDMHARQRLAPAFMAAWEDAGPQGP